MLLACIVGQFGLHSARAGLRLAAPLQTPREGDSAWALGLLMPLATVLSAARCHGFRQRHPGRQRSAAVLANLRQVPGIKRLLVVNWLLSMCWNVHSFAMPILGHEGCS